MNSTQPPDRRFFAPPSEILLEALKHECPPVDDGTPADTVERLTTLNQVLARIVRSYLDDLALAAALGMRMADMAARLEKIEARAERKQLLVASAMQDAGLKIIVEPDFTASVSQCGENETTLLVRTS